MDGKVENGDITWICILQNDCDMCVIKYTVTLKIGTDCNACYGQEITQYIYNTHIFPIYVHSSKAWLQGVYPGKYFIVSQYRQEKAGETRIIKSWNLTRQQIFLGWRHHATWEEDLFEGHDGEKEGILIVQPSQDMGIKIKLIFKKLRMIVLPVLR
jgi:hypothetical protein